MDVHGLLGLCASEVAVILTYLACLVTNVVVFVELSLLYVPIATTCQLVLSVLTSIVWPPITPFWLVPIRG